MMLHEKKIFSTYFVFNNGANENIKKYIYRYFYLPNTLFTVCLFTKKVFLSPIPQKKIGLMLFGNCMNEIYTETIIMIHLYC